MYIYIYICEDVNKGGKERQRESVDIFVCEKKGIHPALCFSFVVVYNHVCYKRERGEEKEERQRIEGQGREAKETGG